MEHYKLWINGEAREGSEEISVVNPANEQPFARIARSNQALADEAIAAAVAAQGSWSATPVAGRQAALLAIADAISARAEELARVLTLEQGKPMAEAAAEVAYTEGFIRHFATLDIQAEVVQDDDTKYVELHRQALGVVACIIPWNFPLLIISFKVPLALLAGNTCVIKPSPTTPLSAALFAEICAGVLPSGVVNTVNDENDLGAYLTSHPAIAKVSFTGSTETGKRVMASAAGTLKRLTLELGGNDPAIVLPNVDVRETAQKIFAGAFMNCGQVCLAIKRVYAHESIYNELCDELARLAEAAVVGDGMDEATEIGPLNNEMQFDKVKHFLDCARREGRIIAGGDVPERDGYFITPTIVSEVHDGDTIVDEEQFGPILPVISFASEAEAVQAANRLDVGLGASVWSSDLDAARELAMQVESGTVWINTHLDFGPNIPFGGAKQSGIGVEFAREGLNEFTQVKVINTAR